MLIENTKDDKSQITEMFIVQADNEGCYFGCIKRLKDENGNPFVFSRIVMPDSLLTMAPEFSSIVLRNF